MSFTLADHFRVQAVFQGRSGLAEDVYVNTWHFRNDQVESDLGEVAGTTARMLDAFYYGEHAGSGASIGEMLSPVIVGLTYRCYDLGQAVEYGTNDAGKRIVVEPRDVREVESTAFEPSPAGSWPLPEEVAVVLSLRSQKKGPRGRGRLYLGPWSDVASTKTDGGAMVNETLRTRVAAAAEDLRSSAENATWVIVSPTDVAAHVVSGGYIDDAFDTVRSRGRAPTTRTQWGTGA